MDNRAGDTSPSDDTSLGILNVDRLMGRGRFFGDLTHESLLNVNNSNATNGVDRRVSDRLNMERKKAIEALQKSSRNDTFKKPLTASRDNSKALVNNASTNNSIPLDHTDYVPFRRPNTINISDLVTDETINLELTSSCPPSAAKDPKISFEPSEMTGRSTLYRKDVKSRQQITESLEGKFKAMSVQEILATSFAPKARNLRDSLHSGGLDVSAKADAKPAVSSVSSSTGCSSFTNYTDSRSLPRTADMSSKVSSSHSSFGGENAATFSFNADNNSFSANEEFAPGELMQSKLILDEISWAQEYAAIPAATLSKDAKAKAGSNLQQMNINGFESPSASNSIIAADPNFSLGNFFHMRSENIWDIVRSSSPDKCRTPYALVDEANNTAEASSKIIPSVTNTPTVDNKTYTKMVAKNQECAVDKDSGNCSDNSYLLSVSAIDRALSNLERTSTASATGISEQLLMQTKKSKSSYMNPQFSEPETTSSQLKAKSMNVQATATCDADRFSSVSELILGNKENLNPQSVRGLATTSALSDTISFTESLLNSSDMKQLDSSRANPRSPLSPINIHTAPNILVSQASGGEEADNDEWPETPIRENRRVRRTKSPHDKSPLRPIPTAEEAYEGVTPVKSIPSQSSVAKEKSPEVGQKSKETKSLCSTRLDGNRDDCDFISPNLSATKTSALLGRNSVLANASPGYRSSERSPLSTPSSSFRKQTTVSPTPANLDATTNMDRQQLNGPAMRKAVSSPGGSETSSTYSYATMHSTRSATSGTARSMSRCSSTSEFSHRDGKPIPLKVTALEISWGSVKLRSDSTKSMQIKNIINKRLVIRVDVSGPGFQIVNNQRSNNITLHSQECRAINISFCPTVPGVAIGKLSFYAPTGANTMGQSFMDIALYGYGGNANVMPQKVIVGPVGSPFVQMGDICELPNPLERTVSFYNKGPLPAFAVITVDSLGLLLPHICDAFEVEPQRLLIPAQKTVNVRIVFKPKRDEIKKIIKKIDCSLALATLRVISGDEANRQRIRRLLQQMSKRERAKLSTNALDLLWTVFPDETEMRDLAQIRENPDMAIDLMSGFRVHEILLTINRANMDESGDTSSLFLPDADETVLFRTVVCAADSNSPTPPTSLGTVAEMYEEDLEEAQASAAAADERQSSWSVKPSMLNIDLRQPERRSLFVYNGFSCRQYFEVTCNMKQLMTFTPSEGYVAADNSQTEILIDVNTAAAMDVKDNVCITVYMENERIVVPVKLRRGD